MKNSPMILPRAAKPSARQGCAEILGDVYAKRTPLPSIPNYQAQASHLAAAAMCIERPRQTVQCHNAVHTSTRRARTLTAAAARLTHLYDVLHARLNITLQ